MNILKASLLVISIVNVIYATPIQAKLITKDNVDELITELKNRGQITDVQLFGCHNRELEYREQVQKYTQGDLHYGSTAFTDPEILRPLQDNLRIDRNSKLLLITITTYKMLGLVSRSSQILYYAESFDTTFYPFLEQIYTLVTDQAIKNKIATINDDYIRNPSKLKSTTQELK